MSKQVNRSDWESLFRQLSQVKEAIRPAYNDAVVPVIGGVIHHADKPKVKLLVIGSGEGVFSRKLLPSIQAWLKTRGKEIQIEVVETDVVKHIKKAPTAKALADMHAMPFRDESFDLVISENAIHQTNSTGLISTVSELKRLLKPNGSIIHVQDNMPDIDYWAPEVSSLIRERVSIAEDGKTEQDVRMHYAAVMLAFENLKEALRKNAKFHKLNFAGLTVQGQAAVKSTKRSTGIKGLNKRGNVLRFNQGGLRVEQDPKIPKGEKKLEYTGTVNILSKTSTSALVEHIEKHY